MGKAKKESSTCEVRRSNRLQMKPQSCPLEKKKPATKRVPKAKKGKAADTENAKAEEAKAEVAEAK